MKPAFIITLLAIMSFSPSAFADDESGNSAHIVSDEYGRCYVKSVPKHYYGDDNENRQQGETRVYTVGDNEDLLGDTYNWFSQQIFVSCNLQKPGVTGVSVVRFGPWQRGNDPRPDHLAVAFYLNGELLKSYSILDIAGGEKADQPSFSSYKNASTSVSHYRVFKMIHGFKSSTQRNVLDFEAITVDGRVITFDPSSGEILRTIMPN